MLSKKFNSLYLPLVYFIWSLEDPITWILDKRTRTMLDLGCGQGNTSRVIKARHPHVHKIIGVELFDEYIAQAQSSDLFSEVRKQDVTKCEFSANSFDTVVASQVIEHLTFEQADKLIENMEKWATRQVIISTPIGECYHPDVDNNPLQLHQSYFFPHDFQKRGYTTIRYGWKWLLDSHTDGLIARTQRPFFRRLLYLFNFFLTPVYYLFQGSCDYIFVAYKDVSKK
jgi:SAM-dependent methyltransferase